MSSVVKQTGTFPGVRRLLRYFRMAGPAFPGDVRNLEEAVGFLNERTELILIPTTLDGDWYRSASGPLLARDRDGMDKAILPDWLGRLYFQDEGSGRRIYLSAKNSRQFQPEAYCVSRDFPEKVLSGVGLVGKLLGSVSWYEGAVLVLWGLLGGGLWGLLARQVHSALSDMVLAADLAAFWGVAGTILALAALEGLLVFSGRMVVKRVSQKGALTVAAVLGERLYAAAELEDPVTAALRLADLRDGAERVLSWLLSALWGLVALLAAVPSLAERSAEGFAAAAGTALALYAAAALVFLLGGRRGPDRSEERRRREWLQRRSVDQRLGIRRPIPVEQGGRWAEGLLWLIWPVLVLLTVPLFCLALERGYSAARLAQTALLYVPAAALPLAVLLRAARAGRAMGDIRALLPLAVKRSLGDMDLPPMGSVFELKDVSFSYPDREAPVLRGVSLRLHPGEVLGVWGATGTGKTTLEKLMTGMLRPAGGTIYYGGIELARYNGASLRRRIAWGRGSDILLTDRVPEERDGRTCVVFSAREETLDGCDRVFRLADGMLIKQET